jgi:hypothetical protein
VRLRPTLGARLGRVSAILCFDATMDAGGLGVGAQGLVRLEMQVPFDPKPQRAFMAFEFGNGDSEEELLEKARVLVTRCVALKHILSKV